MSCKVDRIKALVLGNLSTSSPFKSFWELELELLFDKKSKYNLVVLPKSDNLLFLKCIDYFLNSLITSLTIDG